MEVNKLSINDIILLCTMVVLIWYTWETSKLRKAAQKQIEIGQEQVKVTQDQTEIQIRPFVIIQEIDLNKVKIRNIGTSPAFNIRIYGVRVRRGLVMQKYCKPTWDSLRSYGSISYLGHTFKEPTDIGVCIFNTGMECQGIQDVDLLLADYFLMFKIVYDNVNIQTYYTEQGIKPIIQDSIDLKIFNSGKTSNRTDEDLLSVNHSEDRMTSEIHLTQVGMRRLLEIIE